MCCVCREVIWCRRPGVIDNDAAFAIRRAVFAFKGNETETEAQGIASSTRIKRQECKRSHEKGGQILRKAREEDN